MGGASSLLLLLLLCACVADVPSGIAGRPELVPGTLPQCQPNAVGTFIPYFSCFAVIGVSAEAGSEGAGDAIQVATAAWDSALNAGRARGAPTLQAGGGDVFVRVEGNSQAYCGRVTDPPAPFTVRLISSTPNECAPSNSSGMATALTHELSHVLGFQDNGEKVAGLPEITDGCTTQLPTDHTVIHSTVCQHEADLVYAAYGLRRSPLPVDFWFRYIVTGVTLSPTSITLNPGDPPVTVTASALQFANFYGPGPNPALGSVALEWKADLSDVARVSSTGASTASVSAGILSGATTVRAGIASGLPTGYQLSALMESLGSEVATTVVSGGGGGFRVTDITGITPPIHTAGTHGLTAHVTGQPPEGYTIQWHVTYSNHVRADTTTAYGPPTFSLAVEDGSYNIQVTATPHGTKGSVGTAMISDFPVCTGGGGDLAPTRNPKPDAVGGC